jgi:hypothetical protein
MKSKGGIGTADFNCPFVASFLSMEWFLSHADKRFDTFP